MKNINNYTHDKYSGDSYIRIEEGIFKEDDYYVTSLSFVQEPELEEGEDASEISQYPLEDLLDKFYCHVSDFYEDLNVAGSETCYLEFASEDIDDIKRLREIIGKHVYNSEVERDGQTYVDLVIE